MPRQSSPENLEALASGDKAKLRAIVLAYVRQCRTVGATADEISKTLELVHQSVAPRLTELEEAGEIVKLFDADGKRVRRQTRQGCLAGVYVALGFAPVQPTPDTLPQFGDLAPARWRDDG